METRDPAKLTGRDRVNYALNQAASGVEKDGAITCNSLALAILSEIATIYLQQLEEIQETPEELTLEELGAEVETELELYEAGKVDNRGRDRLSDAIHGWLALVRSAKLPIPDPPEELAEKLFGGVWATSLSKRSGLRTLVTEAWTMGYNDALHTARDIVTAEARVVG